MPVTMPCSGLPLNSLPALGADRWFDQEGAGKGHDRHDCTGAQRKFDQGMHEEEGWGNRRSTDQRPIKLASPRIWRAPPDPTERRTSQTRTDGEKGKCAPVSRNL
jgi:hypothetical protein